MGLRKQSKTLSSNWYKKYKYPYMLLYFDMIIIVTISFFIMKDFAVGKLDQYFSPLKGVYIALLYIFAIIFRFNLSLLMFTLQRIGIFLSIIFAILIFSISIYSFPLTNPPNLYIGKTIIEFCEKFIFTFPGWLEKPFSLLVYFYLYYIPILFFGLIVIFKPYIIKKTAKKFDVLTGFYGSSLSEKLKINGFLILSIIIFIAAMIGIISTDLTWKYLYIPFVFITLHILKKRLRLKLSKNKRIRHIAYGLLFINGILIMYAQSIPYLGIIALFLNLILGFLILKCIGINRYKGGFISIFIFFITPILILGYNPFVFCKYGVVEKTYAEENLIMYYTIKDVDGNLGIRVRNSQIVKPNFTKIEYIGNKNLRFTDKQGKHSYISLKVFIKSNPLQLK